MSVAAPADADYGTMIEAMRRCLAYGTGLSQIELQLGIAVLKDSVTRMTAVQTPVTNIGSSNTAIQADKTALNAFTFNGTCPTGTAAQNVIDAITALSGHVTTLGTRNTALAAATPTVPSYNVCLNADG